VKVRPSVTQQGTKRPGRRPFVATLGFLIDFELVWHRRPRCCYCGELIRCGEQVGWLQGWQPETVHHPGCQGILLDKHAFH
jgi:hypothetical protein